MISHSSLDDISGILEFLKICYNLKRTKRTGWLLRGHPDCESIADHMYMMSVMAMILSQDEGETDSQQQPTSPPLNRSKCIQMALVHDMAEALVGDLTPECGIGVQQKHQMERDAMHEMTGHLNCGIAQHIIELWNEYEAGESVEAQFVKDLDKFEFALQAYLYEGTTAHLDFSDFIQSVQPKLRHPKIVALYEKLIEVRMKDRLLEKTD